MNPPRKVAGVVPFGRRASSEELLGAVEAGITGLVRTVRLSRVRRSMGVWAGAGLDRTAHALLARLEASGSMRLSSLADELAIDVSTLSREVAQAEEQHLVERSPDPSDGRAVLLSLTDAGVRVLERLRQARLQWLSEVLGDWSEDDLRQFAQLLDQCIDDLLLHAQQSESFPHADGPNDERGA